MNPDVLWPPSCGLQAAQSKTMGFQNDEFCDMASFYSLGVLRCVTHSTTSVCNYENYGANTPCGNVYVAFKNGVSQNPVNSVDHYVVH